MVPTPAGSRFTCYFSLGAEPTSTGPESDSGSTRRPQATAQLVASVEHKHLRRSRTFLWEKRSPEGRRGRERERGKKTPDTSPTISKRQKNSQRGHFIAHRNLLVYINQSRPRGGFFPGPRETARRPSAPPCPVLAFSLSLRLERLSSGCRCEDAPDEVVLTRI